MSLLAHLEPSRSADRRAAERRKLRLEARASKRDTEVVIHDLSEEGMLLECAASLEVGEVIDLVIPAAGEAQASVAWTSGRFFGCRFDIPLTKAAVSAALLRSPAPPSEDERRKALYNAMVELRALARVVEEITDRVDRAIARIRQIR